MLKIVCTGPESTGKTSLAAQLSTHYRCPLIPEYARTYIDHLNRPYTKSDLLHIAKAQIQLEKKAQTHQANLIICDTNLLTIKIWAEDKFGQCDPWIIEQVHQHPCDLYLLCDIDIPWTFDPQREDPHRRKELYELYKQAIIKSKIPYLILKGDEQSRRLAAIQKIDELLEAKKGGKLQ